MRGKVFILASVLSLALLGGCGKAESPETAMIPNPWTEHAALDEAEKAVGFELALPETVGDFSAVSFRSMNGELLETGYDDGSGCKVILRKAQGEGQDISGDYNEYESIEEAERNGAAITYKHHKDAALILISYEGFSYSVSAPGGFPGDSAEDFVNAITGG